MVEHDAKQVFVVKDKPEFLSPPRAIVHKTRSQETACTVDPQETACTVDPQIANDLPIVFGKMYTSLLTSSTIFKQKLLQFISTHMVTNALEVTSNTE